MQIDSKIKFLILSVFYFSNQKHTLVRCEKVHKWHGEAFVRTESTRIETKGDWELWCKTFPISNRKKHFANVRIPLQSAT